LRTCVRPPITAVVIVTQPCGPAPVDSIACWSEGLVQLADGSKVLGPA
jgi:hypothetical protein